MSEFSLIHSILLFQIIGYAILSIFFKPDKGRRLYCGIFAFNGPSNLSKSLAHLVLQNIKMLGMYNDDRGGDNAGIVINNKVLKTVGIEYKFKTLIEKNHIDILDPTISTIVIGHSRKGSVGGKGHENAHPFEIYKDEKEDKDESVDWYMTGVHNGTIENWKELLENHHLDEKEFKNDSKTMLKIISRQRKLKKQKKYIILEKYKGNGVFIWYFRDEPDTMYVFKGAHKRYKSSITVEEERPLFFYECPLTKGIYFSSIKDSLLSIAVEKDKVKNLVTNIVLKFKEGKLISKDSINIDRENMYEYPLVSSENTYGKEEDWWKRTYGYTSKNNQSSIQSKIGFKDYEENNQSYIAKRAAEERAKSLIEKALPSSVKSISTVPVISIDTTSITTNKIGKTIILGTKDVPLKNIADYKDKICREDGLYKYNSTLLNGEYIINKKTYEVFSPSKKNLLEQENIFETRYFYEGYMLKDKASLIDLQELDKNSPNWKTDKASYIISKYCSYPVPTWDGKFYYLNLNKFSGYCDGIPYSEGKVYDYKDGKIIEVRKIIETPKESSIPFVNEITYGPIIKKIDLNKNSSTCPNYDRDNIDPEVSTTSPNLSDKEIAKQLKLNEEEEIKQENFFIFDASEREILELWQQLKTKVEEQIYNMDPFFKDKTFNKWDFLSGTLNEWVFDSVHECLTKKSGNLSESPFFTSNEKGELIYNNISKITFF